MTKFFQDYYEHHLSEDEMIEINDLWESICDGDYPDDVLIRYTYFPIIPYPHSLLHSLHNSIIERLRKILTIEVAEIMKAIAFERHRCTENPNYHITKDDMMTINNTANSMESNRELSKITSDKFNNDIDKYDIQLGKKEIAKRIVEDICPITTDEPDYEED